MRKKRKERHTEETAETIERRRKKKAIGATNIMTLSSAEQEDPKCIETTMCHPVKRLHGPK